MISVFRYLSHYGYLLLLLLVSVLITGACGPSAGEPTPASSVTSPPTALSATGPPDTVIQMATQALASSLGLDTGAITLVSVERQEFGDAALECAQPGEMAAAVLTPGYSIVLSAGEAQYELHSTLDGTSVRCLPTGLGERQDNGQRTDSTPAPDETPLPTPDDGIDKTALLNAKSAVETKDYERLQAAMPDNFWLGFYAADAGQVSPAEGIEKLKAFYLEPGLVRVYQDVRVDKLLPDWTSSAPYARFVYSTGWGESQRDDAILLFTEQSSALYWAGLFYIFDGLKKTAYTGDLTQLPPPPVERLGAIAQAVEEKDYEAIQSLVSDAISFQSYESETRDLSPDAFTDLLRREYLEPGEVDVRFNTDVTRILPDWSAKAGCDDLLYSRGWGNEQTGDAILCLKSQEGGLRWSAMLYIPAESQARAYAEPPPDAEEPADVEGMIHVPEGAFLMGSTASDVGSIQAACSAADAGCRIGQFEDEKPQHQVTLDGFYIDKTEVAVADFKAFVEATGYQTTSEAKGDPVQYTWRAFDVPDRQNHPVRWMSWHDANAYCQWAGKRLPTEAEWEKAARGTAGQTYPWGNTWDASRVPQTDTAPVDAFTEGASPYGVLGMAGGVWEWVADWYDPTYYQHSPSTNPAGPDQTPDKVLRGGAFSNAAWKLRTAYRHFGGATGYAHDHGFRCARDE